MSPARKDWIADRLIEKGWRERWESPPEWHRVLDRPHGCTGTVWSMYFGRRGAVEVRGVNANCIARIMAKEPDDETTLIKLEGWLSWKQ